MVAGPFGAWLAAAFLRDRRAGFPRGAAPLRPDGIAVLALKVYRVVLETPPRTGADTAAAIIEASREFDRGRGGAPVRGSAAFDLSQ